MANVISDETIEYVGILAKLELSDEEKEQAKKDMGSMLDYIDKLNELDTSGVEPMSHVFPVNNVFREDVVTNGDDREAILANAPEEKDGSFVVPKTFDYRMSLMTMGATELGGRIKSGEVSVAEAAKDALAQINAVEKDINSYVTVLDEDVIMKKAASVPWFTKTFHFNTNNHIQVIHSHASDNNFVFFSSFSRSACDNLRYTGSNASASTAAPSS